MLKKDDKVKRGILRVYTRLVKRKRMFPTRTDLLEEGITRDMMRHHFGNMKKLREAAKTTYPAAFKGVIDVRDFINTNYQKRIKKLLTKHKRFLITTLVNGQKVDRKFLESMLNYCNKNNAKLILLPSHDPAHNLDNEIEWHVDDKIVAENLPIIFENLALNNNIHISGIRITAKQINPATGLGRLSQGKGGFIFASPKQCLEFVANSNTKLPHPMMSTGACTIPNYKTTLGNSLRTAYLAEHDHILGGLVVEIENDEIYHFRQIQADNKGCFVDLGKMYTPNSIKKVTPKFIMGDYHVGEHDETAVKAWIEIINELKVDEVIFHDLFNGASVNHWDDRDIIVKARKSKENKLSLTEELKITAAGLDRFLDLKSVKRGVIVKSNHDEFLNRWLKEGKFKSDPHNFQVGCKLADKYVDGLEPLKAGLDLVGGAKNSKKLVWLDRDQDYKIVGVECGAHGDKGPNGSRGSIKNIEKAYGKCIIGHSHTPGILRGIYQVGTSTFLQLNYNEGPSSWVHCSCLLYPNGHRQLINSINGKWRLK